MEGLLQSYEKAGKIIESVNSYMQLKAAKKYVSLFFRKYSTPVKKQIRIADSTVMAMYGELQEKLEKKELDIKSR
jgi:deoxyinosine 3'endonuclease (endonuclease V)